MQYFVEGQGYNINKCVIYQDNMVSKLFLKKNKLVLSSKRTKHIKAKYFLIKNYYDSGTVMWANVLTRLLQGQQFRDMQAFPLNCPWDYDDNIELRMDSKVRIWQNINSKLLLHGRSVFEKIQTQMWAHKISIGLRVSHVCHRCPGELTQ